MMHPTTRYGTPWIVTTLLLRALGLPLLDAAIGACGVTILILLNDLRVLLRGIPLARPLGPSIPRWLDPAPDLLVRDDEAAADDDDSTIPPGPWSSDKVPRTASGYFELD